MYITRYFQNGTKIVQTESRISSLLEYYAEVQPILCKDTRRKVVAVQVDDCPSEKCAENLYNQFVMEVLIQNDLRKVPCLRTKFIAQQFVYVWSYLGNFFKKIFEGRRDYPSLLPSCIGLE